MLVISVSPDTGSIVGNFEAIVVVVVVASATDKVVDVVVSTADSITTAKVENPLFNR